MQHPEKPKGGPVLVVLGIPDNKTITVNSGMDHLTRIRHPVPENLRRRLRNTDARPNPLAHFVADLEAPAGNVFPVVRVDPETGFLFKTPQTHLEKFGLKGDTQIRLCKINTLGDPNLKFLFEFIGKGRLRNQNCKTDFAEKPRRCLYDKRLLRNKTSALGKGVTVYL